MRFLQKHMKLGVVAIVCAAIGAGAGVIATAGAVTPRAHPAAARRGLGPRAIIRRTVHADLVVATPNGFVTVTVDRGFVKSLSGDQLTLVEGTRRATYKTVQITLPGSTRVRDNGQRSTLDAVQRGQRATVIEAPHRTLLIARTPPAGAG